MPPRPRIALSMIVKNETPVLRRCLESLRPLVDSWAIVDTGSSDGTQALVREVYADLPGQLLERPWVDFAHNRNEALELARTMGEYIFTIDADETLAWPAGFELPTLSADAYALWMEYSGTRYRRVCLLRTATPWRWRGVLHEYLDASGDTVIENLDGPRIIVRSEGARSRNPRKFHDDAAVLEAALAREPGNTRYQFYLAQSWRDAGEHARALEAYCRRAAMGGWEEECWYSLWQIARLGEHLGQAPCEIAQAYLTAWQARPQRAEPLADLARWYRLRSEWPLAFLYARAAAEIPLPDDQLFVDATVYQWRALDEVAISAWYVRRYREGAEALARLLEGRHFPEEERVRIEGHVEHYRRLGAWPAPVQFPAGAAGPF